MNVNRLYNIIWYTSVKTEEAVDHDKHGTTATGLGQRQAVREAF